MNNEQKFWRSLLHARSPYWKLHIQAGDRIEGLAEYDVAIYVVDTSTGWTAAGMLKTPEFQHIAQAVGQAAKSMRKIRGGLSAGIWQVLGEAPQPAASSPEAHEALVSACADMALTKTFVQVKQQTGGVAGHWVYLVYRLQSGERIGRPVFFGRPQMGLIDQNDLEFSICKIIALDTDPASQASVARDLRAGGGPILCDTFNPFPSRGAAATTTAAGA
ncbi:MAG: hypothetical protein K0Q43_187 [Ramlibacter sp.]|jgi:hypothetical protein|nr:hypothetical protein [Ramlibacter sp.]